ncbi:MAG: cysteine hydrolase [Brevundimonas sp.]|nr:cysteine hydrolase [Brevundimonas sp.]
MSADHHLIRPQETVALLVIDMQLGFDDPAWGPRNNPTLETNVRRLLDAWRQRSAPVVHIHHASPAPDGRMRLGQPGHAPKPETRPLPAEPVFLKSVNSGFIGTGLETWLLAQAIGCVVLVGLTTNHCVSTTARMAANLGFRTLVVADAAAAFASTHIDGRPRGADEVHDAALSDLNGEFATVTDTCALLAVLAPETVHA